MAKSKRELQLEKEVKELKSEISKLKEQKSGGIVSLLRTISIWVLVVISALSINLAIAAGWVRQNIVNNDKWVQNTTVILQNESVQNDIASQITDSLFMETNAEQIIGDFLPDQAQVLKQPLTQSLKSYTQDRVKLAINSEEFQNTWQKLSQNAHAGIISSLENGGVAPSNSSEYVLFINDSQLIMNLKPIILSIQDQLVNSGLSFVSKLPIEKIDSQFQLAEIDNMPTILGAFNTLNKASRILLVFAIISGLIALGISNNKRRTIIGISVAVIALMIMNVQFIYFTRLPLAQHATQSVSAVSADSSTAVFDTLMNGLVFYNRIVIIMATTILAIAILSGPSKFANFIRSKISMIGSKNNSPIINNITDNAYTYVGTLAAFYSIVLVFGPKNTALSLVLLVIISIVSLWMVSLSSSKK